MLLNKNEIYTDFIYAYIINIILVDNENISFDANMVHKIEYRNIVVVLSTNILKSLIKFCIVQC